MTLCATSVDPPVSLWLISRDGPELNHRDIEIRRGCTENLSGKILSQCHGPQNHNIAPALDMSKV